MNKQLVSMVLVGMLIMLTGISALPAMLLGIVVTGIFKGNIKSRKCSSMLLSSAIVLMGFGISFQQALRCGRDGFLLSAVSIGVTLLVGYGLGKLFKLEKKLLHLIACGTAICGGSAIAAVSPVIEAEEKDISTSMTVIFLLNAVALVIFPLIGRYFQLGQHEFGLWSAIAIHDTSSVVGAAGMYGEEALEVATTVKLARSLWIVPISIMSAWVFRTPGRGVKFPLFILGFILTVVIGSVFSLPTWWLYGTKVMGIRLTSLALFLIGTNINVKLLKEAGKRPLLNAILLWLFILSGSLLVILEMR
ncbi:MAG: YeiH family protein [Lentisphaeria bacterium]